MNAERPGAFGLALALSTGMKRSVLVPPTGERFPARSRVPGPRGPLAPPSRPGRPSTPHRAEARRRARRKEQRILAALLRPRDIVWDLGAQHGLLSLLAARRVGTEGEVHAVEPSARGRWFLEHHVRWAGLRNVIVHALALGRVDGVSPPARRLLTRSFAARPERELVPVRTGRSLLERGVLPRPDLVRIDVQGAEADVLRGSLAALPSAARLLIAVHSRAAFDACVELLGRYDYRMVESAELRTALASAADWSSDATFVCFGPAWPRWKRDVMRLDLVGF